MASLMDIPGLGGYLQSQQIGTQQQSAQIQQASALQGILAKVQAAQQEQEYRGALTKATTPEEQYAVAVKYGGPAAVMQSMDRRVTADQTKQIAMSRLSAQLQKDAADISHKARTATTNEEKFHWQQQMDVLKANAQKQAAEIAAGRYTYDTGNPITPFQGAIPQAATAAGGGESTFNFKLPNGQSIAGTAPTEAGAIGIGQNALGMRPGVQVPVSALVPQPVSEAPVASPMAAAAPNDFDARDIRLGGSPQAAPVTPTATPAPAMPPEIARLPRRYQDKWVADQAKASIAGAGKLTPEALKDVAAQYLAGDRQAIQGFARDQATKSAIQNEISKQMRDKGWGGADVAAQMADFAGIVAGSRSVGTRAAQIELASTEALKMMDIVKRESANFDRTNFVPWNMALKAYDTNTGKPEVKKLGAAINSLVNVYARAINPSGVATRSDKEHAREMLAAVDAPDQIEGTIGIMREEMEAARAAPVDVRKATREAVTDRNTKKSNAEAFFR